MHQEDAMLSQMTPGEWIDIYFDPSVSTCTAQAPAPLRLRGRRLRNTDSGAAVQILTDGQPGFRCLNQEHPVRLRDHAWTPRLRAELKVALGV